jgi:hypothetical protein
MAGTPQPPLRRDEQPSVACPHCAAHTAQIKSVATSKSDAGVVNITMFCSGCKESWVVQKMTYQDELPA